MAPVGTRRQPPKGLDAGAGRTKPVVGLGARSGEDPHQPGRRVIAQAIPWVASGDAAAVGGKRHRVGLAGVASENGI